MTDATVVSLCKEYLATWEPAVLMVLCDRLEELGDSWAENYRRHYGQMSRRNPPWKCCGSVSGIMRKYGGDQ